MSYLAWPVSVNGRHYSRSGKMYHMTLKYLGDGPIALSYLRLLLKEHGNRKPSKWLAPIWKPEIFSDLIHVLELKNPPTWLIPFHDSFDDLRTDDFPTYRPHVAVDLEDWHESAVIEFHPLVLADLNK